MFAPDRFAGHAVFLAVELCVVWDMAEISPQRWERRQRKKQAARNRMKKSGMSVRLLQQILGKRAAAAKAVAASVDKKPSPG